MLKLEEMIENVELPIVKKLGLRYLQILLVFFGEALSCAGLLCVSTAVVAMTDTTESNSKFPQFHWNSRIKSYILSSSMWFSPFFELFSGYIVNRINIHQFICGTVLIGGIINIFIPFVTEYFDWIGIVCCNILLGISQSFLTPFVHDFFTKWVPNEGKTKLGAIISYAPNFGSIFSSSISGAVASSNIGWPGIFYVIGGLVILWSVLFYFFGKNAPSEQHKFIAGKVVHSGMSSGTTQLKKKAVKVPWKSIVTSVPVWSLILNFTSQGCFNYLFLYKMPAYMKLILCYDIGESGTILMVPYIIEFIFIFIFGWLGDTALEKGVKIDIVRKVTSTIGSWGVAILILVLSFVPSTGNSTIPLIIMIMIFAFDSANICGFSINHMDIAPNYAGTLISMLETVTVLSGQFGLLACGYIVTDETNRDQWNTKFHAISILCFVSSIVFIIFGKCEPQPWNDHDDIPVKEI